MWCSQRCSLRILRQKMRPPQGRLAAGRLAAPFANGSIPIDFGYWLVWPKGRHLSPDVRAFIKWIKDEASDSEIIGV